MKVRILMKYTTKKGTAADFESGLLPVKHALLIAEDLLQTNRAQTLEFIDTKDVSWNYKELTKLIEEVQEEPHEIILSFDGGYDRKTDKAGLGVVIHYREGKKRFRIRQNKQLDLITSNNEAEYAALDFGLDILIDMGAHHQLIEVMGDSLVVINQLQDEWPCYDETLLRWIDRIERKSEEKGLELELIAVDRKANSLADHLANQALKSLDISSRKQMNDE